MSETLFQIIDANINRISEGLRVIEEYCRFIARHKTYTDQLSAMRKTLNRSETNEIDHLRIRNTEQDMRAKETPVQRKDTRQVLKANFKRVEEGLRVLEEYTGNPVYNQLRYDAYQLEKDIILTMLKKPINPGIYLISDNLDVLKQGIDWEVSIIQLRDKTAPKAQILVKARQLKIWTTESPTVFIVNDHLDIALTTDADGVHTGSDDIPIAAQRAILGPHKIIGRTCHSLAHGLAAEAAGADYVSAGPIYATPTKPDKQPIGFEYLEQARHQLHIPYVAIGGISIETLPEILTYSPPLVALVRDHASIPEMMKLFSARNSNTI